MKKKLLTFLCAAFLCASSVRAEYSIDQKTVVKLVALMTVIAQLLPKIAGAPPIFFAYNVTGDNYIEAVGLSYTALLGLFLYFI